MHQKTARLDLDPAIGIDAFREVAKAWDLPFEMRDDALYLQAWEGQLTVGADGECTLIHVQSMEASGLQVLCDVMIEQAKSRGLNLKWDGTISGARPSNMSIARVVGSMPISPSYHRVTIAGADLSRFDRGGRHFRLLFGPDGADWPSLDEAGATQWPGGIKAWHRPVYTTRATEVAGGVTRLSFDVFCHAGGRTTEWATQVLAGAEIALTGPGGDVPKATNWVGLIGDETALPIIARALEDFPETTQGKAIFFVPDDADMTELPRPPGIELHWIKRADGKGPVEALKALEMPQSQRYVFFAAEKSEALAARAHLIDIGFDRTEFVSATYWTRS